MCYPSFAYATLTALPPLQRACHGVIAHVVDVALLETSLLPAAQRAMKRSPEVAIARKLSSVCRDAIPLVSWLWHLMGRAFDNLWGVVQTSAPC